MTTNEILLFVFLFILMINAAVFIIFYYRKNQFNNDEYTTSITALVYCISLFKRKYNLEINHLRKKYDTNPTSKTKSTDLFLNESEKILSKYVKLIFNSLSKKIKNKLLQYYTLDGIILLITEELKR